MQSSRGRAAGRSAPSPRGTTRPVEQHTCVCTGSAVHSQGRRTAWVQCAVCGAGGYVGPRVHQVEFRQHADRAHALRVVLSRQLDGGVGLQVGARRAHHQDDGALLPRYGREGERLGEIGRDLGRYRSGRAIGMAVCAPAGCTRPPIRVRVRARVTCWMYEAAIWRICCLMSRGWPCSVSAVIVSPGRSTCATHGAPDQRCT